MDDKLKTLLKETYYTPTSKTNKKNKMNKSYSEVSIHLDESKKE